MLGLIFLNPWFLLALLAAFLPILFHLFQHPKGEKILFSSLEFIKSIEKKRKRWLKVRQLFLLIIRTLALASLVLALARPAIKGPIFSKRLKGGTSFIILLDNSFSMGIKSGSSTLWERAKEKALGIVDLTEVEDEGLLLLFSDQPEVLLGGFTHRTDLLKEAIKNAQLSFRTTDFRSSLELANSKLREAKNLNKEIYLISDLQRIGFESLSKNPLNFDPQVRLYLIPLQAESLNNLSVEKVEPKDGLLFRNKPIQLQVTIRDYGRKGSEVKLNLDGKEQFRIPLERSDKEKQNINFRLGNLEPGIHTGFVEVVDPILTGDNRRYFTLRIPSSLEVLVLNGNPGSLFLEKALNPGVEKWGIFNPNVISSLSRYALRPEQVIIMVDLPRPKETDLSNLECFIRKGGGLLIILGKRIDLDFYNRVLLPRLFAPLELVPKRVEEGKFVNMSRIEFGHPIFQELRDPHQGDLSLPQFYSYYFVRGESDLQVLARFSDGSPALLEKKRKEGRVLLFTSSLDLDWSDLSVRAVFLPFLHRMVQYLGRKEVAIKEEILIGHSSNWELSTQAENLIECIFPDGQKVSLKPKVSPEASWINLPPFDFPGIYRLKGRRGNIDALAVNVDSQESNLSRIQGEELKRLLKTDLHFFKEDKNLAAEIFKFRYGKELSLGFLVMALLLFLGEMVVRGWA